MGCPSDVIVQIDQSATSAFTVTEAESERVQLNLTDDGSPLTAIVRDEATGDALP